MFRLNTAPFLFANFTTDIVKQLLYFHKKETTMLKEILDKPAAELTTKEELIIAGIFTVASIGVTAIPVGIAYICEKRNEKKNK